MTSPLLLLFLVYVAKALDEGIQLPMDPNYVHLPPNGLKKATSTIIPEAHETTKSRVTVGKETQARSKWPGSACKHSGHRAS